MSAKVCKVEEREIMQAEVTETESEKTPFEHYFAEMFETIKVDETISDIKREEVLQDLEVVKSHLEEDERNAPMLTWLLSGLESVPSIMYSVKNLRYWIWSALRRC